MSVVTRVTVVLHNYVPKSEAVAARLLDIPGSWGNGASPQMDGGLI